MSGIGDFISADELAALVQRRTEHVLLDVRFTLEDGPLPAEYREGHIPGAVFVDVERELASPRDRLIGSYPLPDADRFREAARRWGLRGTTSVIAYSGYTGISAGRLAWLLRWFGHSDVRVLDGGLMAWERQGYPLVTGYGVESGAGDFLPVPNSVPVVGVDEVLARGEQGQLLDVRAKWQYELTEPDSTRMTRRPGRIPGAASLPSTSLHRRNGRLRPKEEIEALLHARGVDPQKPVAVYCGGGIASAWASFALMSAGIDAALFAKSWSEYVSDPSLPVEVEALRCAG